MDVETFNNLERGNIVRHIATKRVYVIDGSVISYGQWCHIGMDATIVTNPCEWELVPNQVKTASVSPKVRCGVCGDDMLLNTEDGQFAHLHGSVCKKCHIPIRKEPTVSKESINVNDVQIVICKKCSKEFGVMKGDDTDGICPTCSGINTGEDSVLCGKCNRKFRFNPNADTLEKFKENMSVVLINENYSCVECDLFR